MEPDQMHKRLHSKGNHRQNEKNLWTGRRYLQMMWPRRAEFPKYINSLYSSTTITKINNPI